MSIYTGLRIGELLALEWTDIDFSKGELTVSKTCHDAKTENGYCRVTDVPKTQTSRRVIPIPRQILPLLREQKKKSKSTFVVGEDRVQSVRSYQYSFSLLLKKLSIPHHGFHALRHTFATRALECGMDVKTLSEILGHKNSVVTLNRYAHSLMPHKHDATVCQSRQRVKHTYGTEEIHSINDYVTCIYQIIDIAFNVSEPGATNTEVNFEEDDGEYSGFIGSYSEVEDMPEDLRVSCNQLLRDIYDASLEYFSDCVIAFENISKVILDFCMRKINSLSDLTRCLNQIPDDEDEAKLFLMEKLERCGIEANFDCISINVRYAKKCLYNNFDFKKASTLIMFAPMLLAVVDYMAFINLFENLGSRYFTDAVDSVGERGHDTEAFVLPSQLPLNLRACGEYALLPW